jgi:peptide-methionine (R)-S-oxide reductase
MRNTIAVMCLIGLFIFVGCDQAPKMPTTGPAATPATRPNTPDGKAVLTDAQWQKILTKDQYYILRQKGTEPSYDNAYWDNHEKGVYRCAACGELLFSSDTKFDSHTGWPSFWAPVDPSHITKSTDADGSRTELTCPICGGHLGHVFNDGPQPTGKRYCMDSGAMIFQPGPTTVPADK